MRKSDLHPRLYCIYQNMKNRCYRAKDKDYKYYGAKGITVCDEWLKSFTNFYEWAMVNGYSDDLSIDRIEPTKGYNPSNCRWADNFVQGRNKGIRSDNHTGCTGIDIFKGQFYRASICRYNKRTHLGLFNTLEEAVKARKEAEKIYD